MGDDVEGIVIGDKWTEVQARHVLNTIFGTYARSQFLVGSHLVAQGLDLLQELRMALAEGLSALFVASVEHGAVSEDDPCGDHHTVAVGMHTAVHARGIVDDDTTHHSRADARRIRWEHTSVGLQDLIDASSHDTRLKPDGVFSFLFSLSTFL